MIEQIKEHLTWARVAYILGGLALSLASGALGHCAAIASVEPRVAKVEKHVKELRQRAESDRAILHRLDGMISAIAGHLNVRIKNDE